MARRTRGSPHWYPPVKTSGSGASERALTAMASAVRRAREAAAPPAGPPGEEVAGTGPPRGRSARPGWLWWAVALALSLAVAVSAAVAVTSGTKEATRSEPLAHQPRRATTPPSSVGPSLALPPASATPAPTTTEPPVPATVTVAELTSLEPSQGVAGQTVVVTGTSLSSPDGHIQASFGGQGAATSCPSPTTCTVTVPDLGGPTRDVAVTVSTMSGTSNALPFTYQPGPRGEAAGAGSSGGRPRRPPGDGGDAARSAPHGRSD